MTTVGLTGGIASGKSTVARMLVERGAVLVDADVLAREAVMPGTPGLARVVEEFGSEVLADDGSLDRGRLGRIVFSDPQLLAALNAIVHPYVAQRRAELTAAAPAGAVVVHDIPLLVETGREGYDLVVVVDVSPGTQLHRLVRDRGMDEDQARARIAAQADRAKRLSAADVVIANEGTIAALRAQVDRLWERLAS